MSREIKFRAWCETYMGTSGIKKFMENKIEEIQLEPTENDPQGEFIGEKGIWCGIHEAVFMMYVGKEDSNKKEICEGDICSFFDNAYNANLLGVVKFGEYNQDGSGGEYPATPVIGFYIEILKREYTEDSFCDDEEYPEWNRTMSVLEAMDNKTYENFKIIGNKYENPELIQK